MIVRSPRILFQNKNKNMTCTIDKVRKEEEEKKQYIYYVNELSLLDKIFTTTTMMRTYSR
jgi:hypothetical protein